MRSGAAAAREIPAGDIALVVEIIGQPAQFLGYAFATHLLNRELDRNGDGVERVTRVELFEQPLGYGLQPYAS